MSSNVAFRLHATFLCSPARSGIQSRTYSNISNHLSSNQSLYSPASYYAIQVVRAIIPPVNQASFIHRRCVPSVPSPKSPYLRQHLDFKTCIFRSAAKRRNGNTPGATELVTRRFHTSPGAWSKAPSDQGGEETLEQVRKADSKPPISPTAPTINQHLRQRLPNIAHIHRPGREELLAAATGFWSRLKVRFKWFSIRSVRPFNADEIGALFSWVLLGHVLWIILGTTTFFSLAIFAVNTVFAQETLARWVGNYLTKSSGVKVVFESAIVPQWGSGVISFRNVFVSRRPGQGKGKVSKGPASEEAAAAAAAAVQSEDFSGHLQQAQGDADDGNYTQFDLSLDTVDVTLSFRKWFNGKGLLHDVDIKGIRGIVDRTSVHYDGIPIDPRRYKHEHNPGDFEIDSFKLQDLLVTIHQPGGFRPFPVSIYNCDLPQLRRQWLFYDFLSANVVSGSFDNSLFTIHPAQMHGYVGGHMNHGSESTHDNHPFKKSSRLRIAGLNINHLNRGVEGPFSWIHQGNVDIIADMNFPADSDESITKLMSDFYDRMEAAVHSRRNTQVLSNHPHETHESFNEQTMEPEKRFLTLDLKLQLNDIRAAVPIFTRDISYVNNALVRPIVAYMNSRRTFIPINCQVVKYIDEFDGSWTIYDSGLMDDLSVETYRAFAEGVTDNQARMRRFKKVGLWSLQLAAQAFFVGLAGNFA
ncbi:uncharacterized protein KY384_009082 [Bacidia gigantensis]|uniref:uncharacterized protein n=1 Tax=Bacidia gigantensis TaxID=2732470 RepID=UPI001D03A2EA|nr:uncharacterized protein KY384_009082 [Bacidia gigantensis]KAG8525438.1 hypothetical protein KY384_009082 [Bacidia gigantensis]